MGSSLSNLLYHIVFSTKMRHDSITPNLAQDLYPYIGGIIRDEKGVLLKIGGMPNHLHLLTKFHPLLFPRCCNKSKAVHQNGSMKEIR